MGNYRRLELSYGHSPEWIHPQKIQQLNRITLSTLLRPDGFDDRERLIALKLS